MTAHGSGAADEHTGAVPLAGGLVNAGAVFRRGDAVDRPAPRTARALHAHLRALRAHGFDAAPTPLGLSADGRREQLTFVPGDVALPPFPAWVMSRAALESVGRLLRGLHDASATIPLDTDADWPRDLADPSVAGGAGTGATGGSDAAGTEAATAATAPTAGTGSMPGTGSTTGTGTGTGTLLCHNDVCPDNVVFRDGRAVALIDFDLAAPGRPLWDVAMAARYWAPMLDPTSAAALYPSAPDPFTRLRVLADSYGLSASDRAELPTVIEQATAASRAFVAAKVASGDPTYARVLADRGGWPRWDRLQSWLTTHHDAFTSALLP